MIKLKTSKDGLDDRDSECPLSDTEHDAAVAHALERAMGEADKHHVLDWVRERAAEILRTNFGIE